MRFGHGCGHPGHVLQGQIDLALPYLAPEAYQRRPRVQGMPAVHGLLLFLSIRAIVYLFAQSAMITLKSAGHQSAERRFFRQRTAISGAW
jgi:hypothetical protein